VKTDTFILFLFLLLSAVFLRQEPLHAADALLEKGIEEYKTENYEEAVDILLAARYEQPASSIAAFYLGLTYKQMREYKLAERNLREAITLSPPVKDAYLELAEVLYILDALREAKEWTTKSEQEGIKPAHTEFLKGLILLKEGKADDAIAAFENAKKRDQSFSQPADFQIAAAYVQKQRFDEAKKSLHTIQDIDPLTDLAAFSKEYERALSRTLALYKPWQFRVGIAYQYDDNVVLRPGADTGVDISGEKDSSIVSTLSVLYSPLLNGPFSLRCHYDLYNNMYFHTTSHNLLTQAVSVVPGYTIKNSALSLPLSFAYLWVEGDPYISLLTMKPTLQISIAPNHIGQFTIGYDKRELIEGALDRDEDRDGNVFNASAGYILLFKEGRGAFNVIYEFSNDDTDGKNWENTGNRFIVSCLIPDLLKKTSLVLSGDIFLQDYKNTNTVFEKKRKDEIYTVSATAIAEVVKALYLNVQYSYIRADSTIAVYDYDRNIYTIGLEYRF
jgi:predicted negative regulator of RcsB-dependent stress response